MSHYFYIIGVTLARSVSIKPTGMLYWAVLTESLGTDVEMNKFICVWQKSKKPIDTSHKNTINKINF